MKKNYKKLGFTLVELLLVFIIAGVVTFLSTQVIKSQDKKFKYVISNAYHTLARAVYNASIASCDPFSPEPQIYCENVSINGSSKFKFASSAAATGAHILCAGLANYMNATEANCTTSAYSTSSTDASLNSDGPHIKAPNGIWYYIVGNGNSSFTTSVNGNNIEYFIVFADINGSDTPNSSKYFQDSPNSQDRYPFAVIGTRRVIPIGGLEIDKKLLPTLVEYTESDKSKSHFNELVYSRTPLSYNDAKGQAWGVSASHNMVSFNETNQFSYNEPIRTHINSVAGNGSIMKTIIQDYSQSGNSLSVPYPASPANSDYNCSSINVESCSIEPVSYISHL